MLTQKLSSELANRSAHGGHRITVNAVAPYVVPHWASFIGISRGFYRGFVPSKMSSQLLSYAEKEEIERAIPLGRMGRPEDMGGVCLYLSSKAGKLKIHVSLHLLSLQCSGCCGSNVGHWSCDSC